MICGASIAMRNGLHLRCGLPQTHKGSCVPEQLVDEQGRYVPDGVPSNSNVLAAFTTAERASEWSEAQFIGHLLAVVDSAGDTLTFLESINIARSLLRTRLGLERRT
jgi:hypothetical protein